MKRGGLTARRLCSAKSVQTRDGRGNTVGKIRVIFLRSHLRSLVEAVIQTSFLCVCFNILPRNRHTSIYFFAFTCKTWLVLNSYFNIMGKKNQRGPILNKKKKKITKLSTQEEKNPKASFKAATRSVYWNTSLKFSLNSVFLMCPLRQAEFEDNQKCAFLSWEKRQSYERRDLLSVSPVLHLLYNVQARERACIVTTWLVKETDRNEHSACLHPNNINTPFYIYPGYVPSFLYQKIHWRPAQVGTLLSLGCKQE